MAVKVWFVAVVALLSASACGRVTEPATAENGQIDPVAVTRWSGKTELFAEYPPLVVGQTSRFAIHLTDLRTFKAVTAGQVEVQLQGGGAPETFRVDGPSRPGIFGVDVKPSRPGNRVLVIALKSPGLADEHQIPDVIVHGR
jgi:membrane fusion protein, heavy metal efflux system